MCCCVFLLSSLSTLLSARIFVCLSVCLSSCVSLYLSFSLCVSPFLSPWHQCVTASLAYIYNDQHIRSESWRRTWRGWRRRGGRCTRNAQNTGKIYEVPRIYCAIAPICCWITFVCNVLLHILVRMCWHCACCGSALVSMRIRIRGSTRPKSARIHLDPDLQHWGTNISYSHATFFHSSDFSEFRVFRQLPDSRTPLELGFAERSRDPELYGTFCLYSVCLKWWPMNERSNFLANNIPPIHREEWDCAEGLMQGRPEMYLSFAALFASSGGIFLKYFNADVFNLRPFDLSLRPWSTDCYWSEENFFSIIGFHQRYN